MRISNQKPHILFVGAFRSSNQDNSVGGQLYACRTLINSAVSNHVDWILLDSTMESVPPPPLKRRLLLALRRLFTFFISVRKSSTTGCLIFTGNGWGFIEKGIMVLLAKLNRKYVVMSPRSGLILDDLKSSRFMRWYVPFILKRCSIIMCQSISWQQLYQSLADLPSERLVVIPNWFDTTAYAQTSPKPAERTVFLFLGWLEKYKGINDLIEAVAKEKHNLANARFVICGNGSEKDAVKRKVTDYQLDEIFEFMGWVSGEKKLKVLSEAHVLVLPSHYEGLPNALLEGMASGLAVLSTRVGAIPDVISNEELGILIDSKDVNALGESLVKLHYDAKQRNTLAKNAKEYVVENHDINKLWPKVLQLFIRE